jgi:hypothetical protein
MVAVAGLRGTGSWGPNERPTNFREMILWRNTRGSAPIFALSSKANKEASTDPIYNWWDEAVGIKRLQLGAAVATTDTVFTVVGSDPTSDTPTAVFGSALHLVPGDLLMWEPNNPASYTGFGEIIEVVQVLSATTFVAKRGACGTTIATMAYSGAGTGDFLLNMGRAFAEGTSAPKSVTNNPVGYQNYTQIWKTSYEMTENAALTHVRTGDTRSNDKLRRSKDHAQAIELNMIFGQKSVTVGENNQPKRTTGGILSFLPKSNADDTVNRVINFTSAVTIPKFLDAISRVFQYESPGGDERMVFCGNKALNEINKVIMGSGEIAWGPTIEQWGLNVTEMRFPQGTLFFKRHPLFNMHAALSACMLVVDFSAIRWRYVKGRDGVFKDDVQLKDEDLHRGFWLTDGGLEVWYGGQTMAFLTNISAT